jgi:ribosomal protein L7/L12
MTNNVEEIVEKLKTITLLEASELVKKIICIILSKI